MRTESQVKHKLSQVTFRHQKRELRTRLSKKSGNCSFQKKVGLPVLGSVGVCSYPMAGVDLCDEIHGDTDRASKCPFFTCSSSKESIREEFTEFLSQSSRAQVAERYPDVAALLWVLDADPGTLEVSDEDEELSEPSPSAEEPEAEEPEAEVESVALSIPEKGPWWKRVLSWLLGLWTS